jgi:hypothetical protein
VQLTQRIPTAGNFVFFTLAPLRFHSSSSSIILTIVVDPVPDTQPFRKSGSAGNRTRVLGMFNQEVIPLGHRGAQNF